MYMVSPTGRRSDMSASITAAATLEDGGLVDEWERLADVLKAPPFVRPGFLRLWHRWFGDGDLVVASVRRGGQLVSVLPLMRSGHGVLKYPANWHTPAAGILAADHEARAALVDLVAGSGGRRVAIALLDPDDQGVVEFVQGMSDHRYRVIQRPLGRSPYLEMSVGWDEFQARMNAKARRDIRRRRRRLEEAGTVSVEHVSSHEELDDRLREAFLVEGSGWKSERGTAIRADAATVGFYTDLAHWAASRGWLRLTFLRLDGRPLAVSFALWADAVHYGLKTGYDVEAAKHAPGVLVVHEEVRAAFASGLKRVEMLGEEDDYKRIWCDKAHERIGVQAFAPSVGGAASWMAFAYLRPVALKLGARRVAQMARSEGPRL